MNLRGISGFIMTSINAFSMSIYRVNKPPDKIALLCCFSFLHHSIYTLKTEMYSLIGG